MTSTALLSYAAPRTSNAARAVSAEGLDVAILSMSGNQLPALAFSPSDPQRTRARAIDMSCRFNSSVSAPGRMGELSASATAGRSRIICLKAAFSRSRMASPCTVESFALNSRPYRSLSSSGRGVRFVCSRLPAITCSALSSDTCSRSRNNMRIANESRWPVVSPTRDRILYS